MLTLQLTQDGYEFRALRRTEPVQQGWDVYALQTALIAQQIEVGPLDATLGDKTATAIWRYQQREDLVEDGIAGTATQRDLALLFSRQQSGLFDLPHRMLYGQIERESGFLLGNQSPMRAGGGADCGVAQRNSEHTPPLAGFDVPGSILELARNAATHFTKFNEAGVATRRAWELAAGSWNAPAYASWLAGIRDTTAAQPSSAAEATLEAYIQNVTCYVRWEKEKEVKA